MLSDWNRTYYGSIDLALPKDKAVRSLLVFLDNSLPAFVDALDRKYTIEDDISQQLSIYLQRASRVSAEIFMFTFQYKYYKSRRSSDIGVVLANINASNDPFFVIEAKRLPTIGSGREKEYVQGNLGGIERFKRGLHGENLLYSAIIGYIQKEDYTHWHKQINSWISDLASHNSDATITWNKKDLLAFDVRNVKVCKLISSNSRIRGKEIILYHYWLSLN